MRRIRQLLALAMIDCRYRDRPRSAQLLAVSSDAHAATAVVRRCRSDSATPGCMRVRLDDPHRAGERAVHAAVPAVVGRRGQAPLALPARGHERSMPPDPNAWEFPRGTRLWKEFAHGGRAVETRYIERLADGSWRFATYVWNTAGTEAMLAPEQGMRALAVAAAPGGRYAVPGARRLSRLPRWRAGAGARRQRVATVAGSRPAGTACRTVARRRCRHAALVARGWLRNLPPATAGATAAHRGAQPNRARRARLPAWQLRPLPQRGGKRRRRAGATRSRL